MKKLLFATLLSCSSIFAVPAWQFALDYELHGEAVHQESNPISFGVNKRSSIFYCDNIDKPGCGITVTCIELGNDEVEYVAEISGTRATVTAKIGEDASVTLETSQGGMTITFSSKI